MKSVIMEVKKINLKFMIFVDDYNWRVHAKFQPTILGPNTACSKFGFQGVKLYSMLFSKYNKVKA